MTDHSTRFISEEGSVRGAALLATKTVDALVQAQTPGDNSELLGELAVGTILVRQLMAPDLRVQATLQRRAGGSLFVDSFANGSVRGLATVPSGVQFELGEGSILQVTRILENGELHSGTVATEPTKGLSASLTTYMLSSEQINSVFRVACLLDENGSVTAAGGWLLQVLPDHDDLFVTALLSLVEEAPGIAELVQSQSAAELFHAVVDPLPFRELVTEDLRFGCNCSYERMLRALRTVSDEDLAELRAAEETLEVGCDYCGTQYELDPNEL